MEKSYLLNIIIALLSIGTITSCNKKVVHKSHPEFIGSWFHQENNNETWYLEIGNKSSGVITLYDSSGNYITAYGENPKKWRINTSKNILSQGLFNGNFRIDKYPTIAPYELISGYDTIALGETYIILDGDCFLKL